MWMAYAEASGSSSEVVDLTSAVIRIQHTLHRLSFDADHEAVYGMERFYSTSECRNLAESYNRAYNDCERYLTGKINIDLLVCRLQELHLTQLIYDLESFLPRHLQIYLTGIDDDSNYVSEEEESEKSEEEDDADAVPRSALDERRDVETELKP